MSDMEDKEEYHTEKIYYGIHEVSEMLGLVHTTIRHWENEFEVLRVKRDSAGNRNFTKKDIETLKLINHLLNDKGYTIEGARRKLMVNSTGEADKMKLIQTLESVKENLTLLRKYFDEGSD